tara:strand:+ start:168 stop:515 length:348 start_codon:yes stop_codon:yes gene_type:complete
MAKKEINYTDLSSSELELLKDTYIELKVKSMNNNDLIDFAIENISLQIKNTVGNDEELEAWQEMKEFFQDEFDNKIKDIVDMVNSKKVEYSNSEEEEFKNNIPENGDDKKIDMWE